MADRDFRYVNNSAKRFDANRTIGANNTDFNRIRVGKKTLENDVTLTQEFFNLKKTGKKYTKADVEKAIDKKDLPTLRRISDYHSGPGAAHPAIPGLPGCRQRSGHAWKACSWSYSE